MGISSKKREGINEDFGLYVKGQTTALKVSNGGAKIIKDDADWSFCCRVYPDDRLAPINTQNHNLYYDFDTNLIDHGIALSLNNVADTFRVLTFSGGSGVFGDIPIASILKKWSLIVVNYTTATNLFEVYIDNILVGSVDKTAVFQPFGQDSNSSYLFSNHVPSNCLKGIAKGAMIFNRKLTNQERQYIYETGIPPESSFSNLQNYYPLNQVATKVNGSNWFSDVSNVYEPKPNGPVLTSTTGGFDYRGIIYNTAYNDGDKFSCVLNEINNNTAIGFTLTKSSANVSNISGIDYAVFTDGGSGHRLFTTGAVFGAQIKNPAVIGDILEMERSGTDILVRINGVLLHTYTGVSTSPLYLHFLSTRLSGTGEKWTQLKRNGSFYGSNEVFESNIIVEHKGSNHAEAIGWTDDELGLNAGTSTFTAYGDYQTKTLGANFTESGGVVSYKGEEIRKKGLQFNGTSQYLEVIGFTPTSEKGYTVLTGFNYENSSSQRTIISALGSGGFTEYLDIINRASNQGIGTILPYVGSGTTGLNLGNNFASSSMVAARWADNNGVIIPYSSSVYGKSDVFGNYEPDSNKLSGQTIVNWASNTPRTLIGARNNGGSQNKFFNKPITYIAVFKGILNNSELKFIYNNGLLNNPSTAIKDKYDLELFVDFNNPFNDGGTLKFPDLSSNNYTIVANGYTDLTDLESNLVEINSLF